MTETDWPCDVHFDGPFGKSKCKSCGREWEAMTPKGSANHCVRELGSRLAAAHRKIDALEQELMDHAEDWALAGIPPRSDLAVKLTRHYHQRAKDREDAAKWREHEKTIP